MSEGFRSWDGSKKTQNLGFVGRWVHSSTWVFMTKYQRQKSISHISGGCKSKNKVPAHLLPGRAPFLACRWLPAWCILTWWTERERALFSGVSYEDTNPIPQDPTLHCFLGGHRGLGFKT